MKVGVILCYGLFSEDNKCYKEYLDFFAEEIRKEDYDKVIFCGGFTNPKLPDISEATSCKDYVSSKINLKDVYLEEKSINTNQNIEFAFEIINKKDDKVTIYSDLIRRAKVVWIALHFFFGLKQEEIYKLLLNYFFSKNLYKDFVHKNLRIRSFDFTDRTKEKMLEQTYACMLDTLSLYNVEMQKMDEDAVKKKFGIV